MVKNELDAAIDVKRKKIGLGVVVKDDRREMQAAMTQVIPYLTDPIVAESMATWRAISFYRECGFNKMFLEGDSLMVVSELCKVTPCTRIYGALIEDTRSHLALLEESEVRHIRCTANVAAHQLAQMALVYSLNFVWNEACPHFILNTVLDEKLSV
jgi:hypothetical protein